MPYKSELMFQIAVADWLRRDVESPQFWWTAVNPIPAKSKAAAGMSKAAGMRAGVPDILCTYLNKFNHTIPIAIELKTDDGTLSKTQREVHDYMSGGGWFVHTARSGKDIRDIFKLYGIPFRAPFNETIYGLQPSSTSHPSGRRSRKASSK